MSRRHALVTHVRMPAVDRDAGSQLVDHTIRFLLDGGWRVTFLAKEEPDVAERRHAERLRRMGVPAYAGFGWAEHLLRSASFDLALISYWEPAATLVPLVRRLSPGTWVVVNTIDLHFLRDARRSLARQVALDGAFGATAAKELNAYSQADAVLAVSDKERDLLTDFFGDRAFTLPLVHDVERSPHPLEDRRGMVFVGNFRHLPNYEAVEFLCRGVLPLVEPRLVAGHPLTVLGNRLEPARLGIDPATPGVNLVGWVPSVQPYLHRARLAVVPLLHGAGVKGKVVEPMMGYTPVVTTPIGAEGLDLVQAEHALIGSDAADLAAGITRLLTDDELWRRLARQGADYVDARLRPDVVGPQFHEIVERVMARPVRGDVDHGGPVGNGRARLAHALADRIRTVAAPGDVVLVPVGGHDGVPDLAPQRAWPFPEARDGEPGDEPVDGLAAVNHLESQRQRGARWFALPSAASSWRHRYPELLDRLETRYRRLHHDEHLALYDLDECRPRVGGIPDATVHVLGTYAAGRTGPSPTLLAALRECGRLTVTQSWRSAAEPAWSIGRDAPDADYVVTIDDRTVLPARFLEELVATQHALQVDRLQPAHHGGPTAGPPITERQLGTIAREVGAITPLPVLSLRRGAEPMGATVLSDEVTVGLRAPLALARLGTEAPDVRRVWVRGTDGTAVAVDRPDPEAPPRVSVVIATHDRPELLRSCLESLAAQTLDRSGFEVVVVDDGSRDAVVPGLVDELADRLQILGVRIPHAGRAAAKNLAVMLARAPIVLFFDDDDRATPDYLARHLAGHDARPDETVAILGHTDWAPELTRTPLMHYVTDVDRMLFAYERLRDGQVLDWHGFWEGRVSCKRSLLLRCGLHDQRLGYSIDVELAWRLRSTGLRMIYDASALSVMARPIDVDTFGERSEAKGRAHAAVAALHPGTEIASRLVAAGPAELWGRKRQTLGPLRQQIRGLEASASSGDDGVLPELHAAYRELFRILHAKGVATATAADPEVEAPARLAPAPRLAGGTDPELVHDGAPENAGRPPQLSVMIPVWSRTPELADMARQTIERVWEVARVPTEVVVVDNGSPVEVPLPARVYRYPENRGVSVGWNSGIRLSSAPVVAVLNSDCRVEPGWDEALLDAATDGRRIAFPYTDHCDGRGFTRPDQAGTAGWCFALTRDLYDEIGPFDEWFSPAFGEDTDYWHRAWEGGVELSPVPAARVVHARRTSSRAGSDLLLQAHRYKYGWKHGVDPHRAPPYYHREIVDYRLKPKWMRVRSGPDRPRVFCIGLNKTGTSSFHAAMEILGLSSLHWGGPEINRAVRAALDEGRPLLSGLDPVFDAFSDVGLLSTHFDLLDEQYPGSRFMLTVRPLEEWIDSRRRHVERNVARREAGDYDGTFLTVDEGLWREQWERQVGRARRYFEGRRDFLEVNLTARGGWAPLCELLDVPEPTDPFPWANRDRAKDVEQC